MKRLVLLSTALILLIGLAWAAGMFGGPASTIDLPDLAIDTAEISRIDVTSGDQHVRLKRLDSGDWQLEAPVTAPADTATVTRLTGQLSRMELESIVSSNPDRFTRFEVDSSANELTVEWGERRLDLLVGKMGPDFQSRYVRLDGDNRVMLATGVPTLSAGVDQWRDKTLWQFPESAVTGVSVTSEGTSYGVARTPSGWKIMSGTEELVPDSTKVAGLIRRLATVKADGFQMGLTVDSVLSDVTRQVRVEFVDGAVETLLMSKRVKDVAAVREGSTDILKFYNYTMTNLAPELDQLTASN